MFKSQKNQSKHGRQKKGPGNVHFERNILLSVDFINSDLCIRKKIFNGVDVYFQN